MNVEILNQPIDPRIKRFIIPALRKYWLFWPERTETLKRAMVSRGNYRCNICKKDGFKRNEMHVDHIEPVQVVTNKLVTWYDLIMFITRLYVNADALQALDKTCHDIKTKTENEMRKFYNKKNIKKKTKKKQNS